MRKKLPWVSLEISKLLLVNVKKLQNQFSKNLFVQLIKRVTQLSDSGWKSK